MASASQTIKFKQTINVPPAEVYRAFTHPVALRDWLCDRAEIDAHTGGRIYLYWNTGYFVTGEYVTLVPASKLVLTWRGNQDPEETRVQITLAPQEGGTALTLVHSGIGSGKKWSETHERITWGWDTGLENLQSVLETGVDLRMVRRPRLGIGFDFFNAEVAARLGIPVTEGVLIEGTAEGSGAREAGLLKNDVLVKLGTKKIGAPDDISAALAGRHAGDRVAAVLYRGADKVQTGIVLSARTSPEVPASAAELAEAVRQNHAALNGELKQMLEGVTEAQSEHRPAPDAWSVKEIIAHLIACERDYQSWIADMVCDNMVPESLEMRPNVTPRLQAIIKRYPTLPQLTHELECAQTETTDFIAALPPAFVARKHMYRRAAYWGTEVVAPHLHEEHGEQLKSAIAAAQASAASEP